MWTSWVWVFVWSYQDGLVSASNSSPVLLGADCQKPPSLTRGIRMARGKGPPPPRLHGNRCPRFVFRVLSGKERIRLPLRKANALLLPFQYAMGCPPFDPHAEVMRLPRSRKANEPGKAAVLQKTAGREFRGRCNCDLHGAAKDLV